MKKILIGLLSVAVLSMPAQQAATIDTTQYWIKAKASDKFERSLIANTGASIEISQEDYVIAYGSLEEKNKIEKLGLLVAATAMVDMKDFPSNDSNFHNYTELTQKLNELAAKYKNVAHLSSIGKTVEGRDIWVLRVTTDLATAATKPAVIFMGGHHAREHVSVETPLLLIERFLKDYESGDAQVAALLEHRDIHVIPAVNPDGLEFDVATGSYKYWRKNRKLNPDGVYGVDLNRNYGFMWGTGGSSASTSSDTYKGPTPFSEPETKAIRDYVEANKNISILLSFHTFSKLILYPWGHKYDPISEDRDKRVHEIMAQKMSQWNGYTPQQSSDLYIASGDTTDWSYGAHKIISFTFELDPANTGGAGGFYPGQAIIPSVVEKNYQPFKFLLGYADNPYRVLDGGIAFAPGLSL